jgi:hypothetical protein
MNGGRMIKYVAGTYLILVLSSLSFAQGSLNDDQASPTSTPADNATQTADSNEPRIEVIRVNPNGKKIEDQVKELMGQNQPSPYKNTSDFLPYILQMGHGDPTKMVEYITQATRNPASFADTIQKNRMPKTVQQLQQVKPKPEQIRP